MDGKTLPRIGAIAFVAIAITISVIEMRQAPGSEAAATPVAVATSADPLHDDLVRCQAIGQAGATDTACLHAWDESRRRFLGPGARPAAVVPVAAAAGAAPNAAPQGIANQPDAVSAPSGEGAR